MDTKKVEINSLTDNFKLFKLSFVAKDKDLTQFIFLVVFHFKINRKILHAFAEITIATSTKIKHSF